MATIAAINANFTANVDPFVQGVSRATNALRGLVAQATAAIAPMENAGVAIDEIARGADQIRAGRAGQSRSFQEMTEAASQLTDAEKGMRTEFEKFHRSIETTKLVDAQRAMEAMRTPAEQYTRTIAALQFALDRAAISQDQYARAARNAGAAMRAAVKSSQASDPRGADALTQLLKGGGVVALATMAARRFEDLGRVSFDTYQAIKRNEASWSDLAAEGLRAIPILGDFTKAFDEITGRAAASRAEIEELTKRASTVNEFFDRMQASRSDRKLIGLEGPARAIEEERRRFEAVQSALRASQNALRSAGISDKMFDVGAAVEAEKHAAILANIAEEARKPLGEMTRALEQQVSLLALGADGLQLQQAAALGASDAELSYIRSLQQRAAELEEASRAQEFNTQALAEAAAAAEEQAKQISDAEDSIIGEALTAGLSDLEKRIESLRALGVDEMFVQMARDTAAWVDDLEAARRVIDQAKTPLEHFGEEAAKLERLLGKGLIDQTTFDRSIEELGRGLDTLKLGDFQTALTPAIERGSAEAQRAVAQAQGQTAADRQLEIARQQLELQKQIAIATARTADATGGLEVVGTGL